MSRKRYARYGPCDCRGQHGDWGDWYDCCERAAPGQRAWNLRPFAVAVHLAYILALRTLRNHTLALRHQYPMLVLRMGYAVVSLWLLASPMMAGDGRQAEGSRSRLAAAGSTSAPDAETSAEGQGSFSAHAQQRLTAMRPLHQAIDATAEAQVTTTVLCYCLAKAPETVRELRRLAANRFARGIAAWQAQHHHDAITAFTQTIQLHPRNTWAYMNRGLAHARLGHYPQAQADFTSALTLDPKLTAAYYARGLVSILLEQVDEANRDIQSAAALGEPEARRLLQSMAHAASKPVAPPAHVPVK